MIDQVPGYRILERAGEGGFSVVYRALQERLDRVVALKVLSVDAVDADTMRRFERECQITGRLTGHPNVVTVLDTGMSSNGRPFIAMDYFERGSLRDRLAREGPLPLPDVLRAGVKIAGALAATHEAEVLHRDVKPQNILVSRYGEPALADFGVARLVGSSEATHTNAFTPHHAAPEVVNGEPPGVTSDVYSLASSMYQLLAGGPAFKGGGADGIGPLMMRILNDPPPPIQRPDVPPQVFEVIARAMAKEPAKRYPSAVAFATRLQQLQAELRLPVTELAGSDSITSPPPPVAPDHSGLTGPGFDLLAQQQYAPHVPVAHPNAAPPLKDPPTERSVPPAPPQSTPRTKLQTLPPANQPTQPPAVGGHGGLVAAVAGAVLVGTLLGVIGFLMLGNRSKGGSPRPPVTSAAAQSTTPPAAPVPPAVIRAATPRGLRAVAKGPLVALRWRLARGNDYPIFVEQADVTGAQPPQALPKRTSHTTITGLDPTKGYCFKVGSMVALGQANGQPATIAWSKAACIRGAKAE
jgi:serine/threonine-protein kinase PknK